MGIQGQVYYLSTAGAVIQATIQCVLPGGACNLQGSYVISSNITTGVENSTGLAATVRTSNDGYRVFYHDDVGTTRAIQYSWLGNISWGAGTPVLNDSSERLTAITTDGGNNLSAYGIDATGNIKPSILQNDGTWLEGKMNLPPISQRTTNADHYFRGSHLLPQFSLLGPYKCNPCCNRLPFIQRDQNTLLHRH